MTFKHFLFIFFFSVYSQKYTLFLSKLKKAYLHQLPTLYPTAGNKGRVWIHQEREVSDVHVVYGIMLFWLICKLWYGDFEHVSTCVFPCRTPPSLPQNLRGMQSINIVSSFRHSEPYITSIIKLSLHNASMQPLYTCKCKWQKLFLEKHVNLSVFNDWTF